MSYNFYLFWYTFRSELEEPTKSLFDLELNMQQALNVVHPPVLKTGQSGFARGNT